MKPGGCTAAITSPSGSAGKQLPQLRSWDARWARARATLFRKPGTAGLGHRPAAPPHLSFIRRVGASIHPAGLTLIPHLSSLSLIPPRARFPLWLAIPTEGVEDARVRVAGAIGVTLGSVVWSPTRPPSSFRLRVTDSKKSCRAPRLGRDSRNRLSFQTGCDVSPDGYAAMRGASGVGAPDK
jgi:hypothetical protein